MDIFLVVLTWQGAYLQATATSAAMPTANRHVYYTATGIASLAGSRSPLLAST